MNSKSVIFLSFSLALCREIVFPTVNPIQIPSQQTWQQDDVIGSRFYGLTTFGNLPYVECFSEELYGEHYDIAILGAQFDTVSLALSALGPSSFNCYVGSKPLVSRPLCPYELLVIKICVSNRFAITHVTRASLHDQVHDLALSESG